MPSLAPRLVNPASTACGFAASIPPTTAVIVSTGLITPLGSTAAQTWDALLAGRYITDHARVEVEACNGEPRVIALARHAVARASSPCLGRETPVVFDAKAQTRRGSPCRSIDPHRTALVVGTSKGPIESWLNSPPNQRGGLRLEGLSQIAAVLAHELDIRGPRLTISAACASGLIALIRAALLIRAGEADRVLVVAAEASVHPLFIGSFQRLGILPKPGIGCRPFDENRDGFLMSESAAAVWLERADLSPSTSSEPAPRIALDHFAMGADSTHLTGMDPDAVVLRRVIRQAIGNQPLDLIHAHGTGTTLNDPAELAAIEEAVKSHPRLPAIYSHKAALGHSLGASGLVSIVLNCHSHATGLIPPNVRTACPIPSDRLTIEQSTVARPVTRSLAIAAGFGGAIAAVTLAS